MRKIFVSIGRFITKNIDFFHPPFKKYMSLQFFRYGVSGASNLVFDLILFFVIFHYIVGQDNVELGFVTIKPYNVAFFLTFPITLLTGFLLQKYVTFSSSEMKGRVQLFRYSLVVGANLLLNYFGLKLLVEFIGLYPTPSKLIVTILATMFSYFSQKKFTFKTY